MPRRLLLLLLPIPVLAVGAIVAAMRHSESTSTFAVPSSTAPSFAPVSSTTSVVNADMQPPAWVLATPEVEPVRKATQLNPCQMPDPGFAGYEGWDESLQIGQMLSPREPSTDAEGNVRLMFHFHGHEAARKEWVQVVDDAVLVALDLGNNSAPYAEKFADPSQFKALLDDSKQALEKRLGHPVSIGRFGVSAWSAGYAAVRSILNSDYQGQVDVVVLLDGLHSSTLESAAGRTELEPFVRFARRAVRDEVLMVVSHSSIVPPGYISTTQATSYLIWALGGNPGQVSENVGFPSGLEAYRSFRSGAFHALGFRGMTKEDHCLQAALYSHVLRTYVVPRWQATSRR
jgi:hypothetical protein